MSTHPWLAESSVLVVGQQAARLPWLRAALDEVCGAWQVVDSADEALDVVAEDTVDAVLFGPRTPGLPALAAVRRLLENPRTADLPTYLVAPAPDVKLRDEALLAGALDLLTPPDSRQVLVGQLTQAILRRLLARALREADAAAHDLLARREVMAALALGEVRGLLAAARAGGPAGLGAGVEVALELIEDFSLLRAIDSGEFELERATFSVSELLEAAHGELPAVPLTITAAPELSMHTDRALILRVVLACVRLVDGGPDAAVAIRAVGGPHGAVRLEFESTAEGDGAEDGARATRRSLVGVVARGHGGRFTERREPARVTLDLGREPGESFPPPSRGGPGAAGSGRRPPATEPASPRRPGSLPAPPRPPLLPSPEED